MDTVLMGFSNLEQVHSEGLKLLERPHTGAGKKCEEEGVAEMWSCELE